MAPVLDRLCRRVKQKSCWFASPLKSEVLVPYCVTRLGHLGAGSGPKAACSTRFMFAARGHYYMTNIEKGLAHQCACECADVHQCNLVARLKRQSMCVCVSACHHAIFNVNAR